MHTCLTVYLIFISRFRICIYYYYYYYVSSYYIFITIIVDSNCLLFYHCDLSFAKVVFVCMF